MANLAVYVDLRAGDPTPGTRYAFVEARRIADTMGATVCAVVMGGTLALPDLERLARILGQAGSDRVLVASDPVLAGPPLWPTHGSTLTLVARKLRPRLFLFPAGTAAAQLAAPLAVSQTAVFFPGASISLAEHPHGTFLLKLERRRSDWTGIRTLDVLATPRAVVAVLVVGDVGQTSPTGCGEAELEFISFPRQTEPSLSILSMREDPDDRATQATSLVWLIGDDFPDIEKVRARVPPGTTVIATGSNTPPFANLDVLCTTNLILASDQSLPVPPPIGLSAHGKAVLSGPRKPPLGRFPAVFWRAQGTDLGWLDSALRALGSDPAPPPEPKLPV